MDSRGHVFMSGDSDLLRAELEAAIERVRRPARKLSKLIPALRPIGSAGAGTISVSPHVMAELLKLPTRARRVFYGARKRDPENVALAKAKTAAANGKRGRR